MIKIIFSDMDGTLLDEHGKEMKSMEFSAYIEKKMQTVGKRLVFVVGGPYGFSDEVYARANGKISLSKMTFPHDLIRLVFCEQLYRAYSITTSHTITNRARHPKGCLALHIAFKSATSNSRAPVQETPSSRWNPCAPQSPSAFPACPESCQSVPQCAD